MSATPTATSAAARSDPPAVKAGGWPAWRATLLATGLLLFGILAVYRDIAASMVDIWARSQTFAHAYAVAPIAAWLVWRKRRELAATTPRPDLPMLLPLVLVGALLLLGDLAMVNAAAHFGLVGMMVLVVVALIGRRVSRLIAFPLAFLFFAVPFGEFVMPQLMSWTADFTVTALRASGVPVFREGLQLLIPTGAWSVVEACSGIRYLIASVMVGTLYAYLNYRSLRKRLLFVGISILLPIVANWVRAYLIVLLGHLSSNRLAVGVDHLIYGWLFFGVVVGAMFWIGSRWADDHEARPTSILRSTVPTVSPWRAGVAAAVAALVSLAPALAARSLQLPAGQPAPALAALMPSAGWRIDVGASLQWRPDFPAPSAELGGHYVGAAGDRVGLYLAYYRGQGPDVKQVSSTNQLVASGNPTWSQVSQGLQSVALARHGRIEIWAANLRGSRTPSVSGVRRLVAWRLYWVDDRLIARDSSAKLHGLLQRLKGLGDDGATIVIYGESQTALQAFLDDNFDGLRVHLTKIRDGASTGAAVAWRSRW